MNSFRSSGNLSQYFPSHSCSLLYQNTVSVPLCKGHILLIALFWTCSFHGEKSSSETAVSLNPLLMINHRSVSVCACWVTVVSKCMFTLVFFLFPCASQVETSPSQFADPNIYLWNISNNGELMRLEGFRAPPSRRPTHCADYATVRQQVCVSANSYHSLT